MEFWIFLFSRRNSSRKLQMLRSLYVFDYFSSQFSAGKLLILRLLQSLLLFFLAKLCGKTEIFRFLGTWNFIRYVKIRSGSLAQIAASKLNSYAFGKFSSQYMFLKILCKSLNLTLSGTLSLFSCQSNFFQQNSDLTLPGSLDHIFFRQLLWEKLDPTFSGTLELFSSKTLQGI